MKQKHILILGGSSDIGIEVIKIFLGKNWKVTAHFNTNNKFLKRFQDIHNFSSIQLKLGNVRGIEKRIKKMFKSNYHSIINLVGYIDNKSFNTTNLKNIISALTINAILPTLIIRQSVPFMLREKWGRVVNGSSLGIAYGGGEYSYNYNLSKHLLEFIPNKYKIWAKNNVLINNVRIGHTQTKIHKKMIKSLKGKKRISLIPINRMAKPREMANYLAFLASEENSFMTNRTLSATGGE